MFKKKMSLVLAIIMLVSMMPTLAFGDVNDYSNHWASEVIAKWKDKGVIGGYEDGSFRPQNIITRAEFAQIIVRIFGYSSIDNAKKYSDVSKNDWFYGAVNCVSSLEIMNNSKDTIFRPNEKITREEAVYAIANAYKTEGKTDKKFVDEDKISVWAVNNVKAMLSNGFIKGTPQGYFNPQEGITRAELITIIDNITDNLINKSGNYTDNVKGNLVVNTKDVTLKNMTITGNLYLGEGIGNGDIILDNITVKGKVFIEGGGVNSIKSKYSKFYDNMIVIKKSPVRVVVEGEAIKIQVAENADLTLTGNFSEVIMASNTSVNIINATINKVYIEVQKNGSNEAPKLKLDDASKIGIIDANGSVNISGKGTIENLIVNVNGVVVEQKVENVTLKENVEAIIAGRTEKNESSTGTIGDSNNGGSEIIPPTPSVYYYINGKVTAPDGTPVQHVDIKIWSPSNSNYGRTDVNGNFRISVKSNNIYNIEAQILSDENKGYSKTIQTQMSTSDISVNIQLEQVPVIKYYSVDKNNVPINNILAYRVVNGVQEKYAFLRMNSFGASCEDFKFASEVKDDYIFIYKYFIDSHTEEKVLHNVTVEKNKINEFLTEIKLIVDVQNNQTISGKVIDEKGNFVSGAEIKLWEHDSDQLNRSRLKKTILSDSVGGYSFTNSDVNRMYSLDINYANAEGCHILSGRFDPRVYSEILAKRVYSIKVTVLDSNDIPIPDVLLTLTKADQYISEFTSFTKNDGICYLSSKSIEPGIVTIDTELDGKIKTNIINIAEGNYKPYELIVKFDDITTSNTKLTINALDGFKICNTSLEVGEITLIINGKYCTTNYIKDGIATIVIPIQDVGKTAELIIYDKFNKFIFRDKIVISQDLNIDLLTSINRYYLSGVVNDNNSNVVTGAAISLNKVNGDEITVVATDIKTDDNGNFNISNLVSGYYTINIEKVIDGVLFKCSGRVNIESNNLENKIYYVQP